MIDNRELVVQAQDAIDAWKDAREAEYQAMYAKLQVIIETAIKKAYEHGYRDGLAQRESEGNHEA